MAIAVDSSTPAKVAQTSFTSAITTASFTPPAGALLAACAWCSQDGGGSAQSMAITDSLSGSWTTALQRNTNDSGAWKTVAGIYWRIATGAAMTVTATDANSFFPTLKVLVLTGVDTASPIGSTAGQSFTSASGNTTGYTISRAGSMGLFVACNNTTNLPSSSDATASENGPASSGHYGMYGYKLPLGSAGGTNTHALACSGTVAMHVVQVEIQAANDFIPSGWHRRMSGLYTR